MTHTHFQIPGKLNLLLEIFVISALVVLLWAAGRVPNGWWVMLLALGYGILMNTGYALLHEAEHNLFHRSKYVNEFAGVVLGLFFPAPFHLLRQGHLGHHMRNRSDDEAFDFYFEGENPVWKHLQLYGILTGLFWIVIAASNILGAINPAWLGNKKLKFDRPTEALQETLNPKYLKWIQAEAILVLAVHGSAIYFWQIAGLRYLAVLFGFGFIWSALQYVHHFGTTRDVQKGARNLKTFAWLDLLWLNHNWHLNHHVRPTVPWPYLPFLREGTESPRGSLVAAYLRMWRGPRFTTERVQNRYAGRIIN